MTTAWFCLLAFMVTMYVVLDGFDLGVGAMHLLLGRNAAERGQATAQIGPVWSGNEVWLIAAGGLLFMAFPAAYAAAFSGLYFGLIIVLWLLVGRGLALELRHQLDHPLWTDACDTVFALASAALALVFGVALGNVVRGVPLNPNGYFSMPLFDILNWYAILIGVFGLVALAGHGSSFLAARTTGGLGERSRRWALRLWWPRALLFLGLIGPTFAVRDDMFGNLVGHPWTLVFPLLAAGALVAQLAYQRRGEWLRGFFASSLFLAGLLATMAAGLYPNILPAHQGSPNGLTIGNAAAGSQALKSALLWWPIGMVLAGVYFVFAYRMFFRTEPEQTAAGAE